MAPAFKREGRGLDEKTKSDALFLRVVSQFNGTFSGRVVKTLDDMFIANGVPDRDRHLKTHTETLLRDPKWRENIVRFMKKLDVGIENITLRNSSFKNERVSVEIEPPRVTSFHTMLTEAGKPISVAFDMESDESEGTRKLYTLAGALLLTLLSGSVLIIDEFDSSLHPSIARRIVELFNSKTENRFNAQLIFATHDTNLLDKDLLRRDQIWFTEKDKFGTTHLYSLAEFKPRNDAAFEKNYIAGRYGAIPYLGDLSGIVEKANA